jgi:hypothetical protein
MNVEFNRVTWYSKLLAVIVFLAVLAFGFYLGTRNAEINALFNTPEQVACTADAFICPDGSAVGRTGPNCEFAACPTPNTNTGNDAGAIDIPGDYIPQ